MSRAAVIGAGSWGTVFAQVLVDAGTPTTVLARRGAVAEAITERHENPDYLPGVTLPSALAATTDPHQALDGADIVVLAVHSQQLRRHLGGIANLLSPQSALVSLMKGVELGTDQRMSEVIAEVTGADADRLVVVSGPNLAGEIAQRQPAAAVVACADLAVAERVQAACHAPYFRPYTNHDVVGVELGGAVKNVIALAVGMAVGLGYGDNTRASIITRGLAETVRIGEAEGAEAMTFAGLAGMGDLVASCSSPLARNRAFGEKLGRGMTVEQAIAETSQVAEGVESCRSIYDLATRHGVAAPITEHVMRVVHDGMSVADLPAALLARDPKHERDNDV